MDQRTKDQYSAWLSGEEWTFFFTGTFRDEYTANAARKSVEWFFSKSSALQWGIVFIESGKMYGRIHVHGLLKYRRIYPSTQEGIRKRWDHFFGRAKVEIPRSQAAVSTYAVKYAMKHAKDETYLVVSGS